MSTYVRANGGIFEKDIWGNPRRVEFVPACVRDAFEFYGCRSLSYDGFEACPLESSWDPPVVVERIVERPFSRTIERVVERPYRRETVELSAGATAAVIGVGLLAAVLTAPRTPRPEVTRAREAARPLPKKKK